jgi:hypothetical protein
MNMHMEQTKCHKLREQAGTAPIPLTRKKPGRGMQGSLLKIVGRHAGSDPVSTSWHGPYHKTGEEVQGKVQGEEAADLQSPYEATWMPTEKRHRQPGPPESARRAERGRRSSGPPGAVRSAFPRTCL